MFTWENLDNAAAAYTKLIGRVAALKPEDGPADQEAMKPYREKFAQQMGNDLNTSMGVTALFDVLKAKTNDATKLALIGDLTACCPCPCWRKRRRSGRRRPRPRPPRRRADYTVTGEGDPAIDALVMQRYEAKKAKNFAEADRIRDELKAQGIEITIPRPAPAGSGYKRKNNQKSMWYATWIFDSILK